MNPAEPPRVLLVAPSAYPLGGVAEWLDYLVPGLERMGWRVVVGLVAGAHHDAGPYLERHPFAEAIQILNPTGSREGRIRAIYDLLLDTSPDLIVAVNIPDTYLAVARLRKRKGTDCRVAMALHGIQPDLLEDVRSNSSILDGVICTNRLTCELAVVEAGMDRELVYHAPYGVQAPSTHRGGAKSGGARPLQIVYCGRIEQFQKRVFDIPAILGRFESMGLDYEFVCVGDGPDLAHLRRVCSEVLPAGRAEFHGEVPFEEMVETVYRRADVLLVTSYWETGPLVLWEAMMHRVAVVSSRFVGSGLEGSLEDGRTCLVYEVGDSEAAARALARCADPGLRSRLVANAYDFAMAHHTHGRSFECWRSALETILEKPPRKGVGASPVGAAGRLDRWLGTERAENVRRLLGVSFSHGSAGGEWPHSYGTRRLDDQEFWERAHALDTAGGRP